MSDTKPDRRKPPLPRAKTRKNSHTSAHAIKRKERVGKAMELRLIGYSYEQIGKELKCDPSTAFRMVDEGLRNIAHETGEQLLVLELERLNTMQSAIFPNAAAGDMNAISTQLRIQERRSRYQGIDKPVKTASTDPEGNALPPGAAAPPVFIVFGGKPPEPPLAPAAPQTAKEPEDKS